jgi:hypothetical protein
MVNKLDDEEPLLSKKLKADESEVNNLSKED